MALLSMIRKPQKIWFSIWGWITKEEEPKCLTVLKNSIGIEGMQPKGLKQRYNGYLPIPVNLGSMGWFAMTINILSKLF